MRGQSETGFILALGIMIAFLLFLTTQIQQVFPEFSTISGFDFGIFGVSLLGIAGTCVVASGIPCVGALAFFSVVTFFTVENTLVASLVFLPLGLTIAYVISRLARGGG